MPLRNKLLSNTTLQKSSGVSFIAQLLLLVAGIGTSVITAQVLGPEGRGIYALVVLSSSIAALVMSFGVPRFTACFSAEETARNLLVWNAIYVALLGSGLIVLVAIITSLICPLLGIELSEFTILAIAALAIPKLASLHSQAFLQGLDRIILFNIARITGSLVRLLLLVLLLLVLGLGLRAAILAAVISVVVVVAVGSLGFHEWLGERLKLSSRYFVRSLKFGGYALASQIVGTLNQRVDLLIVGIFLGTADAGIYSVAIGTSVILWHLPIAIATSLLPKLTSRPTLAATHLTAKVIKAMFCLILAIAFIAYIAAGVIPLVYGAEYNEAKGVFRLLLPGTALYSIVLITRTYFMGVQKKPQINGFLAGLSLILDLVFIAILLPSYGIIGVAIACTLGYSIAAIVALGLFSRLSGISIANTVIPRKEDFSFVRMLIHDVIKKRSFYDCSSSDGEID